MDTTETHTLASEYSELFYYNEIYNHTCNFTQTFESTGPQMKGLLVFNV